MAVYGIAAATRASPRQQALDAVKTVLDKTVVQPGSARDALAAFTQGEGDVLLGYENEAIKAQDEGEDVDYVVPPSTILIETPIAVTKDAPAAAQEFLDYIWSDAGQKIWAENGYRPVNQKPGRPEAVPDPRGPVHDRRVRRLGQGQRRVLRRRQPARWPRSRRNSESPPAAEHGGAPGNPSSGTPGRHPPARARRRPRARHGRALPVPDRDAAAGRGGRRVARPAASAPSGTRSPAPSRWRR